MKTKTLLSLLLIVGLFLGNLNVAYAANPVALFELDCNSLNKRVKVGLQTDPDNPSGGEEIIAFKFKLRLTPVGNSTVADLSEAKFENNPKYSNLIVAQKSSIQAGNTRELNISGGFTGQQGVNNVPDLLFITGSKNARYVISVVEGEMYPKNSTTDIYINQPTQTFDVEPTQCAPQQADPEPDAEALPRVNIASIAFAPNELNIKAGETVVWTNADNVPHTVNSVGAGGLDSGVLNPGETFSFTFTEAGTFEYQCNIHPSMRGSIIVTEESATPAPTSGGGQGSVPVEGLDDQDSTDAVEISLDSSSSLVDPGAEAVITAEISNRGENTIDWSQTEGSQIQPEIRNEELGEGKTRSTLTFTMPDDTDVVTLQVQVGDESQNISIASSNSTANRGSAPDDGGASGATDNQSDAGQTANQAANQPANQGSVESNANQSLQDRLRARREQQQQEAEQAQANAQPVAQPAGNLFGAAQVGLAQSGPGDTALLLIISALLMLGWRSLRKPASDL